MNESQARPALLDQLPVLGDVTRGRILLLVERFEVTVAELCAILQAPQSTVSRHLKALAESGWVTSRADGTSRLYSIAGTGLDSATRRLWQLVRQQLARTATAAQDAQRLDGVLARRRTKSQEFFSSSAGQWDQTRETLFGRAPSFNALLGLLDESWVVGDLGCGTGQITEVVAPCVRRVIAVDESAAMLQAARKRLRGLDNVDVRRGALESLPLADAELDAATCILVLHHVPEPAAAIAEMARVLRPGGRLLLTDMLPHDREQYRQQMGHVWLGFQPDKIIEYMKKAGLRQCRTRALPADPQAQGPVLFAAAGRRPGELGRRNGRST